MLELKSSLSSSKSKSSRRKPVKSAIPKHAWKIAINEVWKLAAEGYQTDADTLAQALHKRGCTHFLLYYYHAAIQRTLGKFKEAETSMKKVLATEPREAKYLTLLADIQLEMGNFDDAAKHFKEATILLPDNDVVWANAGSAYYRARAFAPAVEFLETATRLNPGNATTWLDLAHAYNENRQRLEAYEALDKVTAIDPKKAAQAVLVKFKVARNFKDTEVFRQLIDEVQSGAHGMRFSDFDALLAEIEYLELIDQFKDAVTLAESGLHNASDEEKFQLNFKLGSLYQRVDRVDDAIASLQMAVDINPDIAVAKWNLSLLQLSRGDLKNGYENYETRWNIADFPSAKRKFSQPKWNGEDLTGKSILIWAEQGIGDQIKFASMIADLEHMSAKVTVEVAPKLVSLIELAYPWATVRPAGPTYCIDREEYADFDFQIPVFSLAQILRPTLQDFYDKQRSWIPRQTPLENEFRQALNVMPGELLIGVCWRSSYQTVHRNIHYLEPVDLFPLSLLRNVKVVCLQYDRCEEEVETIRKTKVPIYHFSDLNQKDHLQTTSGLISACDIVLSVGTAVVELAAAMGVPTILFKPLGGEESLGTDHVPWNPTVLPVLMNEESKPYIVAQVVQDFDKVLEWAETVSTVNR